MTSVSKIDICFVHDLFVVDDRNKSPTRSVQKQVGAAGAVETIGAACVVWAQNFTADSTSVDAASP
jgi:hypothetical protein